VRPSTKDFEPTDLKRAEDTYREQLRSEPDDLALRLSLAWCLFMQALHRSGQEAVFTYTQHACTDASAAVTPTDSATADRSANALLKDCLQQTYTIKHLSLREEERLEVARLHALVEMAGAQDLVIGAEVKSVQRLVALAREAMRTVNGIDNGID
jgi:hypothetical protein